MRTRVLVHGFLVVLLLLSVVPPVYAQEAQPDPVLTLLDQLSAEAKIGQLVFVSFPGTAIGDDTEIAALIRGLCHWRRAVAPGEWQFWDFTHCAGRCRLDLRINYSDLLGMHPKPTPLSELGETAVSGTCPLIFRCSSELMPELDSVPVTAFISNTRFSAYATGFGCGVGSRAFGEDGECFGTRAFRAWP